MNQAQTALYFRHWGLARKWYIAHGIDPKQADAKRHALHKQALGHDKSSKEFTNPDLDKVLAAFQAVHDGGNLNAQLRQIDQPEARGRALHARIASLAEACGIEGGIEGLEGYLKNFMHGRPYARLSERELQQVAGILERRAGQLVPAGGNGPDPF